MFPCKRPTILPPWPCVTGQLQTPKLEGITLGGDIRVIYSPIDLEAGWEPTEYPMAIAYRQDTAIPLGMNILMYAATH